MIELVRIERNDVFTDTFLMSRNLKYEHRELIALINRYKERFERLGNIYISNVKNPAGRGRPLNVHLLNESQAVFLVTLLNSNDEEVLDVKQALAMEFVAMRKILIQKQTQEWQIARLEGKKVRLQETDAIKALVEYAEQQGSTHASWLYKNYSSLVKKLAGYSDRATASVEILELVNLLERVLAGIIIQEMIAGTQYKQIYQIAKSELKAIRMRCSPASLQLAGGRGN